MEGKQREEGGKGGEMGAVEGRGDREVGGGREGLRGREGREGEEEGCRGGGGRGVDMV